MMRLNVLGECAIELGDVRYTPAARHLFALLLRLGVSPGKLVPRTELAALLFPDARNAAAAGHNARQLIYLASNRGAPLVRSKGAIALDASGIVLDLDVLLSDENDLSHDVRCVDVLPGYVPDIGPSFADWLELFREQAHSRLRHRLVGAIEDTRVRGDLRALEARASECLSIDPMNESATFALAESLARTGSKQRAVATLNQYNSELDPSESALVLNVGLLRRRIERDTPRYTRVESAFTGRGDEMALLSANWQHVLAKHSVVTLIAGEPGIGKTRLMQEHLASVRYSGSVTAIHVNKASTEPFRPFGFFADLVPRMMNLPGAIGCDPQLMGFLRRFTDAPSTEPGTFHFAGEAEFIAIGVQRAVVDLISALSVERPCIFTVDDSRAFDPQSMAVLEELNRREVDVRAQFIITVNEPAPPQMLLDVAHTIIRLTPLERGTAREMARSIDRDGRLSPDLREWCLNGASGNPEFLSLLVMEALSCDGRPSLPRDVLSAVDRSITALSSRAQRVLECCVILDDHCDAAMIAAVLSVPPFDLIEALNEVEKRGHISFDGTRINTRSALLRERTLYAASSSVISLLHARAAELLSNDAERGVSSWRIAAHWREAGQLAKARQTLRDSWRESLELGRPAEAAQSIRAYLSTTPLVAEQIPLLEELIEVLQASGDVTATIQTIDDRAEAIARSGQVDTDALLFSIDRIDANSANGLLPATHIDALMAAAKSTTVDDLRRSRALFLLMLSADLQFNADLALKILHLLSEHSFTGRAATTNATHAMLIYHCTFGDLDDALMLSEKLMSAIGDHIDWIACRIVTNLSIATQIAGNWHKSVEMVERFYMRTRLLAHPTMQARLADRMCSLLYDQGEVVKAAEWSATADRHRRDTSADLKRPEALGMKFEFAVRESDFDLAERILEESRALMVEGHSYRIDAGIAARRIKLASARQLQCSARDLETLYEWHFRARCLNRHDEEMEGLWLGLISYGRDQEASKLLLDYMMKYRRERRPARYQLAWTTRTDPCWTNIPKSLHCERLDL